MAKQATLKLIEGTDALNKEIDSVIRAGKKLDDKIQLLGLSLLAHVDKHNNVTMMNRLLVSFPKGSRRNAFAEWALANGKFKINEGDDKKEKPFLYDGSKTTTLDKAQEIHWTAHKPEKPIDEVFDFQKALAALLTKASKADQDKLVGGELLAKVRQLTEA